MMKCVMLMAGLLLPTCVAAQLTETDTVGFELKLSLNGSRAAGNIERTLVALGGEMIKSNADRTWVYKTQNSYRYGAVRSIRTENDFVLGNYLYYQPDRRVYPYLMALYENNLIKRIDRRIGGGGGITFAILKTSSVLLKVSTTAFVDYTLYSNSVHEGVHQFTDVTTFRPSLRIFWRYRFKNGIIAYTEGVDQFSVTGKGNHRIAASGGLVCPLSRRISFTSRIEYTHEDIVSDGVQANDWYSLVGLNLQFQNHSKYGTGK